MVIQKLVRNQFQDLLFVCSIGSDCSEMWISILDKDVDLAREVCLSNLERSTSLKAELFDQESDTLIFEMLQLVVIRS
ncbi:hypothetical protein CEXT_601131 [Caerostris extrusa]|uniref:Uncharacterized protein n=1 Tax=Caerostris extrusa TaxID=172846 RepID=A0AAV4YB76_CAEEX|nr:hypothetical protein CEXT_601131 [Caerostris extrusa]